MCNALTHARVSICVFGMQKNNCVVWCVVPELTRDLCLVSAHVVKLPVLHLTPLASKAALCWLFGCVQSFVR